MPSGTPGKGYAAKAAFRLIGYNSGAFTYPTALGTPTPQTLSVYDQIPFVSEGISEQLGFEPNDTLDGYAGRSQLDIMSKLASGNIELQGHYEGIGQIIAAAMGYEKVREASNLESPTFDSGQGSGTATSGSSSTLVDSGKSWTTNQLTGMWVRVEKIAASVNSKIDVRRVVSNTGTTITVSPNWTTNPGSGDAYRVGAYATHTYEMAKHLHSQPVTDVITSQDAWNNSAYLVPFAVLGIDKGVAVWEWQCCAVESLTFKLGKDGLTLTAEIIPFGVSRQTASRNYDSSGWRYNYHYNQGAIAAGTLVGASLRNNRILRGDATFRLDSYSTGTALTSADNLGITEFELKIKNNLQVDLITTGTNSFRAEPVRAGRREVTGSFTVPRHIAVTRLSNYTAADMLMASLTFTSAASLWGYYDAFLKLWMRSLKLTKADVEVGGPQVLEEKFNFTCLSPAGDSAGMPTDSEGADNSEVIVQLQNCDPFNYFMGQHQAT